MSISVASNPRFIPASMASLMSSLDLPASQLDSLIAAEYCYFASLALYCYDYILTFERELRYFWTDGLSSTKIAFFTVRYSTFIHTIIYVLAGNSGWAGQSTSSCTALLQTLAALYVLTTTGAAVIAAMRIYAIWNHAVILAAVIFCLGMVNPGIVLYSFISATPALVTLPFKTCTPLTTLEIPTFDSWLMGARASSMVSDGIVLVLTWWKLRFYWRTPEKQGSQAARPSAVLLRDTSVYFGSLFWVNLVGLALGRDTAFLYAILLWLWTVTAIMIGRLLLNLRETSIQEDEYSLPAVPDTIICMDGARTSGVSVGGAAATFPAIPEILEEESPEDDIQEVRRASTADV